MQTPHPVFGAIHHVRLLPCSPHLSPTAPHHVTQPSSASTVRRQARQDRRIASNCAVCQVAPHHVASSCIMRTFFIVSLGVLKLQQLTSTHMDLHCMRLLCIVSGRLASHCRPNQQVSVTASMPRVAKYTLTSWLVQLPPELFGGRVVRGLQRYLSGAASSVVARRQEIMLAAEVWGCGGGGERGQRCGQGHDAVGGSS
eukprot:364216-Chlamydomonas_euryale.AAC.3